jgi:acetylornithine deacetylase/succinyl-diaminopimelate desuccinylase-like protein
VAAGALAAGAAVAGPARAAGASDRKAIYKEIERRHDESVKRLQEWIGVGSIAAENVGMAQGCDMMRRLALDAGFQRAECLQTKGHPGVFATMDNGAKRTLGLYFMYDVKQVNPEEWSSPPWEARLVDMPDRGKVVMGRGAVNQKGPQASFLAALHAIRGAGRKIPVNLVLVAEGEEEIGSPNFSQIVLAPEVRSALSKSVGVFMPSAEQEWDGSVVITLGNKGDIECDLIASGEKWGRGPTRDVHSSLAARVDQPAWHLVQALNTLVTPNGDPAIDGFFEKVRPLTPAEHKMLDLAAKGLDEKQFMESIGLKTWARNATWRQALEDGVSRPTVTIEVVINGGMNEVSSTSADSELIRAEQATYRQYGIEPLLLPRSGGSDPSSVFTGEPLKLASGSFGMGFGERAHAPDEYYVIESNNPKVSGIDGAVKSFVDCLYTLG